MTAADTLFGLVQEALLLALLLIAPPLLASALLGTALAAMFARWGVHDALVNVVPRLLITSAAILVTIPWAWPQLIAFTERVWAMWP